MPRYKVTVTQLVSMDVWVEAESEEEMNKKAIEEADTYLACYTGDESTIEVVSWEEVSDGE